MKQSKEPGVITLVLSMKLGFTNIFFIECNGGYLQVDTSYSGNYSKFLKELQKLGISTDEIKYLFLTHHHDDHSGFAAEMMAKTDVEVIVHENAIPFLEKGKAEETIKPLNIGLNILFKFINLFHDFVFDPVILRVKDTVISGDISLLDFGIDGDILYTPGHSDDHLSLVLEDGSAFVGDAAMNFLRPFRLKCRPIFIQDMDAVFTSWQKIIDHGAEMIYCAHGKPFKVEKLVHYKKKLDGRN